MSIEIVNYYFITQFSVLSLSANAVYDCRFFYFHSLMKSAFSALQGFCVYTINKIIHGCLQIWNFSSRVQLDILFVSYKLNIRGEIPYRRSPMYYSPSTGARETSIFNNCSKVLHVKPNTWHMHSISTILQHPMYGFLLNKNFMIFQLLT